ncbi:hypothetical protein ANANG_G00182810 [Anguilla anguilla]|uniref:Apolipoprotein C-III n=1 Tax=Anguilla anguilla TaxID=7936 RepID=A0A9D3M5L7_ANGAN|nr:hypothetical protein ANANG_G00182810 [Anguilla anguilla]
MSRNLLIISLVLVCLAWRAMSQDEDDTHFSVAGVEVSGVLKMAEDTYRTAVEKVNHATEAVKSFAETSYEDYLKPAIEPSITWVTTAWDNTKTKLSDYWNALLEDES